MSGAFAFLGIAGIVTAELKRRPSGLAGDIGDERWEPSKAPTGVQTRYPYQGAIRSPHKVRGSYRPLQPISGY